MAGNMTLPGKRGSKITVQARGRWGASLAQADSAPQAVLSLQVAHQQQ